MLRKWDAVIKGVDLASSICVAGMVVVVGCQVILRYMFSRPPVWADELARWLFVWNIFLGAGVLVRYEAHLTVDIVTVRLSPRVNQWRKLFVNLLVLAFMLLLFWQTVELMRTFSFTPSAAMQIPMGLFFGSGMIFATIAVIEYVRQTIRSIRVLCGEVDESPIVGPGGDNLKEAVKL